MQTKLFILHEEVYLPRDTPKAVVGKASHAFTPSPPQKGHQKKCNRTL